MDATKTQYLVSKMQCALLIAARLQTKGLRNSIQTEEKQPMATKKKAKKKKKK